MHTSALHPSHLNRTASTLLLATTATAARRGAASALRQVHHRCMVAGKHLQIHRSTKSKEASGDVSCVRQKTLNRFLGLPLETIQPKVDSLLRKQARLSTLSRVQIAPTPSSSSSVGQVRAMSSETGIGDDDEPRTAASATMEEASSSSKGAATNGSLPGKKRRVVESSDEDDSGDSAKQAAGTAASKNKQPSDENASPLKVNQTSSGSAQKKIKTETGAKASSTAKSDPNKDDKAKPKIASIFAPSKPKAGASPSATSSSAQPSSKGSADKGKSKAAADVEVDEDAKAMPASDEDAGQISGVDENGREEADDSAMESEEEGEQAAKIAEIFTKKAIGSSKGKYGKALEWPEGKPVPYAALAEVFERIDSTTKRLEIAEYLTNFLCSVIERTPKDLLKVVYLCINRICPDYEGLELGIGEGMLKKAIAQATGVNVNHINAEYKKVGDLGLVAMNSRATQSTLFKPKALTVEHVFNKLKEIAKTTGASSQAKKVGTINGLLAACQGQEAKFIIRSLEGKLRIGLAEQTVLGCLAHAIVTARHLKSGKNLSRDRIAQDLEEGSKIVKSVFSECPSYDKVVPPLLEGGPELLQDTIKLTPGIPLKPMLAKPTKAITEVLDRFEGKTFTCEYKYDGERAQVHYYNNKLAVFSRNSEDMSVKYPDLIDHMQKCIKPGTETFVLDAEAVAWDKDEGKILPFQELSRRKRKDVKAEDIKVKVHIFAFDLLYLNGESLLKKDLAERRRLLREHFTPVEGQFAFAKSSDAQSTEEIQALLDESIKDSCEGLMVKMLEGADATYEPSRRSMNWLKLKKDYLAGVGDSFDLVVIGGYHGRGKRTSVYGAFLLACYDPDSETYQAITKIGTGFSEEMLESHYKTLHPLETSVKKPYYDIGEAKPDVYFEPKMLWEVLAADLSLSPVYSAAKGLIDPRGVSLRFPRFIRIRDDKDPEDASNAEFVAEAYQRQAAASGQGKGKKGRDDEGDGFW